MKFLGDAPGDGTLVGQPEDHGRLTRQIDHAFPFPRWSVLCVGKRAAVHPASERVSASARVASLAAEVDQFDVADGAAEEARAEALEFLH